MASGCCALSSRYCRMSGVFAESLATTPDDQPKNLLEAIKLYASVTVITFVALSFVFFVLWIAGWILEFGRLVLIWFKSLLLER